MDISKKMARKLDFESAVHQQISQLLSQVDSFKGTWGILARVEGKYLRELRKMATVESIGSSTRIEGATLTDDEIKSLLKSVKITKFEKRDEQEVVGYYEALELILENFEHIPITQNYIHQLHSVLLKHSDKDQTHKGEFKTLSNQVVAQYPDGTQKIVFRTTEPHLTAAEMEGLLAWTDERLTHQDMHPLITIAAFVYEFLSIHPYQDGNGRLSRLLTTLMMMKMEYRFVQYISFEHIIETKKRMYYEALMAGQRDRYSDRERISQWIIFFLTSLIEMIKRLESKYALYSKLRTALNPRQSHIVTYIKQHRTAQIKEITASLVQASRNTIKKDLALLVREGFLLRTGQGRGARYHIQEDAV